MNFPTKPLFGLPCNGCGYCCSVQPCSIAEQFLNCAQGPCVALERKEDGSSSCGMVRNPLGYLWQVLHPEEPLMEPDGSLNERDFSAKIAAALGVGRGCDSSDDEESARWPFAV